jgi:hypothetical protein
MDMIRSIFSGRLLPTFGPIGRRVLLIIFLLTPFVSLAHDSPFQHKQLSETAKMHRKLRMKEELFIYILV